MTNIETLEAENVKLKAENAKLKQTLAWVQRLPELEWAEMKASIMMRLAMLARGGEQPIAKEIVALLDKGATYVNRLLAERDRLRSLQSQS